MNKLETNKDQDCQNCGNYLNVLEQVLATKTNKMLCEFCLVVNQTETPRQGCRGVMRPLTRSANRKDRK